MSPFYEYTDVFKIEALPSTTKDTNSNNLIQVAWRQIGNQVTYFNLSKHKCPKYVEYGVEYVQS